MRRIVRLDLHKIILFLLIFFAYSYCSVWGYPFFEYRVVDYLYGGLLLLPTMTMLLKMKIKMNFATFCMLGIIAILLSRNASVTYLAFYLSLASIVIAKRATEYKSYISKLINIFSWIHLAGMIVTIIMPELYVRVALPAFSEVDYYSKLQAMILERSSCVGFTNQSAHFAGFMAIGIGNRLTLYSDNRPKLKRRNFQFILLSFVGMYLSGKRAHFVFCSIAVVIICYYQAYLRNSNKALLGRMVKILFFSTIGVISLWVVSLYVEGTLLNDIFDSIANMGNADMDITTGRVVFWSAAMELFLENIFFGMGWKQFYQLKFYGMSYDVHNIYLQLLCEVGIIGAALFFAIFIYALLCAVRSLKQKNISRESKHIALLSLFYQVFFLMYGITGNPLYDASYYIFYFICVALVVSIPAVKGNDLEVANENRNCNLS